MYTFFSKEEKFYFYNDIIICVAKRMKISKDPFTHTSELRGSIEENCQEIGKLLDDFFENYNSWYEFSYIEGKGREINEPNEEEEKRNHEANRDEARRKLIDCLNSNYPT